MSSESNDRTPSNGIVGALAAHARGFMNSLLGIGRKARMSVSRMIYPDYDAITDLLKENERILGKDRFSDTEMSAGQFCAPKKAVREAARHDPEEDLFEKVDGTSTVMTDDTRGARAPGSGTLQATPTSDTQTVEPGASFGTPDGFGADTAEKEPVSEPETGARQFFPDLEPEAEEKREEPAVISFPIEDEVVDMMILTLDGIVGDAMELGDSSEEEEALPSSCEEVPCRRFYACDGTFVDLDAPVSVPYDAEEQAALIEAGVEVFTAEAVEALVREEAERQARVEAAVAEAAAAAGAVAAAVRRTVDRLAAEEAERQERIRAALAQAALIAQAVRDMTDRTIGRIAEEEAAYVPSEAPGICPEAFAGMAEDGSSDVIAVACTGADDAAAEEEVLPVPTVSFGFFGSCRTDMSRASTVSFMFGKA